MAANFIKTFYEDEKGVTHPMRVSEEVLTAITAALATGPAESPIPAKITKSNRQFGLRPRGVRLARVRGTAPDQFRSYAFLPIPLASAWGVGDFAEGSTVEYNGFAWEVVSLVAEDYS